MKRTTSTWSCPLSSYLKLVLAEEGLALHLYSCHSLFSRTPSHNTMNHTALIKHSSYLFRGLCSLIETDIKIQLFLMGPSVFYNSISTIFEKMTSAFTFYWKWARELFWFQAFHSCFGHLLESHRRLHSGCRLLTNQQGMVLIKKTFQRTPSGQEDFVRDSNCLCWTDLIRSEGICSVSALIGPTLASQRGLKKHCLLWLCVYNESSYYDWPIKQSFIKKQINGNFRKWTINHFRKWKC